ncbi:MAG TPA: hypothetical protein VHZ03_08955 [Trebonia sp.]|jgi:hypothetical protein|nr:hypothetical protein [Trebonia sp.]
MAVTFTTRLSSARPRGGHPHRALPLAITKRRRLIWPVSLVVCGLVYGAFPRSLDLTRKQAAIKASDRELEELARQ